MEPSSLPNFTGLFHHPQRNPLVITPHFFLIPVPYRPRQSLDLPIFDPSYKWKNIIRGLLWLASFTQHNVFKVNSWCSLIFGLSSRWILCNYCWVIWECLLTVSMVEDLLVVSSLIGLCYTVISHALVPSSVDKDFPYVLNIYFLSCWRPKTILAFLLCPSSQAHWVFM